MAPVWSLSSLVVIQFVLEMTRSTESASISNITLVTELSLLTLLYMIKNVRNDKSDRSITYLENVLFGCFRIEWDLFFFLLHISSHFSHLQKKN